MKLFFSRLGDRSVPKSLVLNGLFNELTYQIIIFRSVQRAVVCGYRILLLVFVKFIAYYVREVQ